MSDRYRFYNPNPNGQRVGDCTVRAICKATGKTWEQVFTALAVYGFMRCDMPTANHVWGAYLKKLGFRRELIGDEITVEDFCRVHPDGVFILAIDGHVVCVSDGEYFDSWDSGQEIPVYYWTR